MAESTIIEAGRIERRYWAELWRYRELFQVLAWRDLSIRYKQTAIGVIWAVVRPLLTVVVFTIIFGKLANLPSEGTAPYALMVLAGMLPWSLFSAGLSDGANSVVNNANLISKVYFPRILVPAATIAVALVDFVVSFSLLALLLAWYQFMPSWQILFLPAFILLACLSSLGPALWFAALNVRYRDFRYVVPFVVQFGLYVSPVAFSSKLVPEEWRWLYALNPMVGIIEGFRWSILGHGVELYLPGLIVSVLVTAVLLWYGVRQFRKMERGFADVI